MKALPGGIVFAMLIAGCASGPADHPYIQVAAMPDRDARVVKLVESVSEMRMRAIIEKLTTFGTRHTMSDQTSPTQGIGAARQWILEEFQRSSPKLEVSFDTYRLAQQQRVGREVELRNVMAILPGKSPRRIYIGGHYDSRTVGVNDEAGIAPGANDDGSGVALTMELARAFAESGIEFDATLVFICWAGEEQGLLGARAHAQKLAADQVAVEAYLNNDIVGNTTGGNGELDRQTVRVYADGPEDSMSRSLARYVGKAALSYVAAGTVRPMARQDRFGRSSDHAAFNQLGFPAVAFRESKENFSRQHTANDTIDGVDFGYLLQNARINAATAACLALAPPAPRVTSGANQPLLSRQPSGYDANLRWGAPAGAVRYRIYWRDTWSNDWKDFRDVGNVTQFVLPNMSIDDYVFGVSAFSADGHESLIRAYVNPSRRDGELRMVS